MAWATGDKAGEFNIRPQTAAAYPEAANSKMLEMNRKDFEQRFKPIEDKLLTEVTTQRGEKEAQDASGDVTQQAKLSRGEFMRNLSRTNTTMTTRQKGAVERSAGLAEARGQATAKNLTRRTITEQNLQRSSELIGIGRDIQQGSSAGIGEASSLAASRGAALKQAEAARKAQTRNTIATVGGAALGIAAAFFL